MHGEKGNDCSGVKPPLERCPDLIGRGDWAGTPGTYAECDVVHQFDDGKYYLSIADHPVAPETEPGVGEDWEAVWVELPLFEPTAGSWVSNDDIDVTATVGDTEPTVVRVYLQSTQDQDVGQAAAWSLVEAPEQVAFSVSKTSGNGPMDFVDVTLDPTGLLEGVVTGILQFNNIGSDDTPITIDLRLEVLPLGQFIRTESGGYLLTENTDRTKTETST